MAGGRSVAIEVQLSPQDFDEYERRTGRYRRSGVKTAWLVSKPHFDRFTLASAKSNGWASPSSIGSFAHRPDIPAFAVSLRCPKGEPVYESIRVEVHPREEWPMLELWLDDFAVGLARGALIFSKDTRLWTWNDQRDLF